MSSDYNGSDDLHTKESIIDLPRTKFEYLLRQQSIVVDSLTGITVRKILFNQEQNLYRGKIHPSERYITIQTEF